MASENSFIIESDEEDDKDFNKGDDGNDSDSSNYSNENPPQRKQSSYNPSWPQSYRLSPFFNSPRFQCTCVCVCHFTCLFVCFCLCKCKGNPWNFLKQWFNCLFFFFFTFWYNPCKVVLLFFGRCDSSEIPLWTLFMRIEYISFLVLTPGYMGRGSW